MEAKICCAYNATRGCRINSTVTVADSAREPLKVLKVLVEGLARDSKSSLWLTPLAYAPQLTRIFPFDVAYLDAAMRVVEAMALRPETPAPRFHAGVASALILPFNSLQSSGTVPGDWIIVCSEDEIEQRIEELSRTPVSEPVIPVPGVEPVAAVVNAPIAATSLPFTSLSSLSIHPFPNPQISVPTVSTSTQQGTGFTHGMTASSWQISNSTTASAVLEPVEIREADEEGAAQNKEERENRGEVAVGETSLIEEATETALVVAAEPKAGAPEAEVSAVEPVAQGEERAAATAQVAEKATAQPQAAAITADSPSVKSKKDAEKAPAKLATTSATDPVTTKKTSEEKKKESVGVLVKRFLNCEDPLPERRSIIRLLVQGLIAYSGEGEEKQQYEVRDVSPTGLYLRTEQRWRPGDVVSLVLQRKAATEQQCERRVHVELKAIRSDEDGVGFEWLWPDGVEFEAWKRVHTKRSDETDADYFLRELRLTRALGFLRQICPAAQEEMKLALHKRLSNKRVASAVEITLKAQELLTQLEPRAKMQAHPDMVRRILENGSWTEDDWIRQWWGGLLVSSCNSKAPDTSNSVFIDLLSKLTPVHLRVLSFVCRKATERIEAGEPAAKLDLYCTSEELIEAVGSHSLARIQQTMGQLASLALLAESNKPSYVSVTDKVKTRATPTALALTMYARCNGHQ